MNEFDDYSGDMSDELDPDQRTLFEELRSAAFSGPPVAPSAPVREFVKVRQVSTVSTPRDEPPVHDMGEVTVLAGGESSSLFRPIGARTLITAAAASFVLFASVGVGHAAGVIDVPLLPDVDEAVVFADSDPDFADSVAAIPSAQATSTTTTIAEDSPSNGPDGGGVVIFGDDDGGVRFEIDLFGSTLDDETLEATIESCHDAFDLIDADLEGEARRAAAAVAAESCRDTIRDAVRESLPDVPFLDPEFFDDEFPKRYEEFFRDGFDFEPFDHEELEKWLDEFFEDHPLPPGLLDPEKFFDEDGAFHFEFGEIDPERRAELEERLAEAEKRLKEYFESFRLEPPTG